MKREGLRHPKTQALALQLGVNKREAIGLLDMLWDWACDYAPSGNIGKWADEIIASAVEWTNDAAGLIEALVGSGWLDRNDEHRLIIHDWPDHAPAFLKAKLKKVGLVFLDCYSILDASQSDGDSISEPSTNPTKPHPSKPNPTPAPKSWAAAEVVKFDEWDGVRPIAQKLKKFIRPTGMSLTTDEREWVAKIAVLAGRRGEAWIGVAYQAMKSPGIKTPQAFMHKVLDGECIRDGSTLNRELAQIEVPDEFTKPSKVS